jgi:hypothetical protein
MKRSDSTSIAFSRPRHEDRQTLVRQFVDHVEHPEFTSIVHAIFHEVA